jgi:hypothetical protein
MFKSESGWQMEVGRAKGFAEDINIQVGREAAEEAQRKAGAARMRRRVMGERGVIGNLSSET